MQEKVRSTSVRSGSGGTKIAHPLIFDFLDYRAYLRRVYDESKALDKRFSCRYVASRVGFKSASFFSQILNGRTELTSSMALRFAAFLKLDAREIDYFETLVLYARAASVSERRRYLGRLASMRETHARSGFGTALRAQVCTSPDRGAPPSDEDLDPTIMSMSLSREGRSRVEREIAAFRSRVLAIAKADRGGDGAWCLDVRLRGSASAG